MPLIEKQAEFFGEKQRLMRAILAVFVKVSVVGESLEKLLFLVF
jgi:hypothetical protein